MIQNRAFITHAHRTAITNFGSSFSTLLPSELGGESLKSLIENYSFLVDQTDFFICGNVLSAGHGQNIARQVAINAGISESVPSFTINQVCGSGMQAIILGLNYIRSGNADIVIAGGVESMSQAAHCVPNYRWGNKMGHTNFVDTMISDGLWDVFNDIHMGVTAENVARKYNVSRQMQDEFAYNSHKKAAAAQLEGFFDSEIVPITVIQKKLDVVIDKDEFIRSDIDLEKLSKLRPIFDKEGTVTAGNASGLNDGAAFVVLMSEQKAKEFEMDMQIECVADTTVGYDPKFMGAAPIVAIEKLIEKSKLNLVDIDLFEINEAFAAQAIAVQNELGISSDKLNVAGGAIALGHPIGASGARVVVSLAHHLNRTKKELGVASLCVGGGQATSLLIKNN
jgi:acetyl-CoA C-acetyltransferase